MPMMMSQILKSVDFTETEKSTYLENETLFFLQLFLQINGYIIAKNSFVLGVTFKTEILPKTRQNLLNLILAKYLKYVSSQKLILSKIKKN